MVGSSKLSITVHPQLDHTNPVATAKESSYECPEIGELHIQSAPGTGQREGKIRTLSSGTDTMPI